MHLDQPERLAWLLLIPLLYWLSRPPRPRQRLPTAHLQQWLAAEARVGRRRLRFPWLRFLLLCLGFAALVTAWSRPLQASRPGPRQLSIILDLSASMAATDTAGRSRLSRAKEAIRARLNELEAHIEVRLLLGGRQPRPVLGSRAVLRAALVQARPEARADPDLDAWVERLTSADTAVWTLTDIDHAAPPRRGALTRLGVPAGNAAILALRLSDPWPLPGIRGQVLVRNEHSRALEMSLELEGGARLAARPPQRIAAGAEQWLPIELRRGTGGAQLLRLRSAGPREGRADDDLLAFVLPEPPRPRLVLRQQAPAQASLKAAAELLAADLGGEAVEQEGSEAGFLMTHGGRLAALPADGRCICLGTVIGAVPPSWETEVELLDWDRADPLCRGLDFSGLQIRRALRLQAQPGDRVLLRGSRGPLLLLRPRGDGAAVLGAFRLQDSNLDHLAAFPQLLRRALAAGYGRAAQPQLPAPRPALESRLTGLAEPPPDRALPAWFEPGSSLVIPLLLLALGCVLGRFLL